MKKAATTLLLADASSSAFKLLMIRRHAKARFMANVYVFPGGCVDPADVDLGERTNPNCSLSGFRVAALRELNEECGVVIGPNGSVTKGAPFNPHGADSLAPYAHWVTPKQERYRYDTWFFAAEAPSDFGSSTEGLVHDEKEVSDIKWVTPKEAIDLHLDPSVPFRLPPPTYIVMKELLAFRQSREFISSLQERAHRCMQGASRLCDEFPTIEPSLAFDPSGKMLTKMYLPSHSLPAALFESVDDNGAVYRSHIPVYNEAGEVQHAEVQMGGEMPELPMRP